MARSLSPQDLIQLPRLSAAEALALITGLLTVADKAGKLPARLERARARLATARDTLAAALRPTTAAGSTTAQARRKADLALDAAWSATFDWLAGWCKLDEEDNPHRAPAQALFALVFPDALSFTKLPYKVQWAESGSRLEAIASDGHEETFKALGGAPFLKRLRKLQKAYGDALGITAPAPEGASAPEVRGKLDVALGALRDYAVQGVAIADPEIAGSERLSETLLKPLSSWESSAAARSGEDGGEEEGTEEESGGDAAAAEGVSDTKGTPS
jgi:hypothetical protein